MAYTATEREAAKEQAREVLREVAEARELITYVDLVARLSAVRFHQRSRDLHRLLGEISEEENARSGSMLSAVVVAKDSNRPGPGFFELAAKLGRKIDDERAFWREELDRVYEAHSPSRRSPVSERAISVRLDGDAEEALSVLVRSGMSRSEAIRSALIEAARRRRRERLAEEARQLAADPEDRAEKARIAELMEALRAAG